MSERTEHAGREERLYWLHHLEIWARPVLTRLAEGRLRAEMPVESSGEGREAYTHLEAFGRLLDGIAPWLGAEGGSAEEQRLRTELLGLTHQALEQASDPASPDVLNFGEGHQPIVDTAFLCQAFLRAPHVLWDPLTDEQKRRWLSTWKLTRTRKPFFNNWLLFSAVIETALARFGDRDWDPMRIDYALKQLEQWYAGDGVYGDGPAYHADYYNSFVIHPMLLDVLDHAGALQPDWEAHKEPALVRAQRYAEQLERMIAPDGSFPVVGRSISYRTGAFHLLAQLAWQRRLPEGLDAAQVRGALTAVMKRCFEPAGTYDAEGWLRIGLSGHQPELGEGYISTGSLYLCATVLLPLALPENDPFWQGEAEWTSKRIWSGGHGRIDHALGH
uniref:DUF2264 domain-containing protein n=1 Tax=Paenibacillus terrae TaxID=159743 RepID=UPI0011A2A9E7|nr:DUF2264 domain-containing protein [Paenibacillus terrae]